VQAPQGSGKCRTDQQVRNAQLRPCRLERHRCARSSTGWRHTSASGTRAWTGSMASSTACKHPLTEADIDWNPFAAGGEDRELVMTRTLRAPRALLWRCFEEPDLLRQWWGPEHFTIAALTIAFRTGGHWHVTIRTRVAWSSQAILSSNRSRLPRGRSIATHPRPAQNGRASRQGSIRRHSPLKHGARPNRTRAPLHIP